MFSIFYRALSSLPHQHTPVIKGFSCVSCIVYCGQKAKILCLFLSFAHSHSHSRACMRACVSAFQGLKYNQNSDWWSFGVLLYEMLVAQSPFSGCDEDALFWSICNEIPWYPFYLSDDALNILGKVSVARKSSVFTLLLLMEIELTFKSFGIWTPHRIALTTLHQPNQIKSTQRKPTQKQ